MVHLRAIAAILLLAAAPAGATTLDMYGFGARSVAMGNASEAAADDYFAAFANPANLALAQHIHLGYGTDLVFNQFAIERQGGQEQWPTRLPQNNYLAHVGISTPLPGWLQDKAALGVAVHVPVGGPTRLDSLDHRIPQLPLYDTLGDRLALVLSVAVRPQPWLALGVGTQVLTALSGRADIGLSVLDQRVTYKALQVDLATVLVPMVGVTVLPKPNVRVAAVWRAQSAVRYELPLLVNVENVGTLDFAVKGVGLWLPESLALASSWQGGPWLATAGVAWQRWSQMPPLAPEVLARIDDSQLVQPGSKTVELLYAHNQPLQMGAKDVLLPKVGVEYTLSERWVARGGANYRPTPLPKADGEANYLDAAALTLAVGAGAQIGDPLEFTKKPLQVDVALGVTALTRRTVSKRDPDNPVGATSVSGQVWHVAIGIHHDF